ncbi:MAG TPA: hypothetical protein VGR89_04510, partial [Puia sp.]|nr:hypothetical protein [Puia sp.]
QAGTAATVTDWRVIGAGLEGTAALAGETADSDVQPVDDRSAAETTSGDREIGTGDRATGEREPNVEEIGAGEREIRTGEMFAWTTQRKTGDNVSRSTSTSSEEMVSAEAQMLEGLDTEAGYGALMVPEEGAEALETELRSERLKVVELERELRNERTKVEELVIKLQANSQLLLTIYQELDKSLQFERVAN